MAILTHAFEDFVGMPTMGEIPCFAFLCQAGAEVCLHGRTAMVSTEHYIG